MQCTRDGPINFTTSDKPNDHLGNDEVVNVKSALFVVGPNTGEQASR